MFPFLLQDVLCGCYMYTLYTVYTLIHLYLGISNIISLFAYKKNRVSKRKYINEKSHIPKYTGCASQKA